MTWPRALISAATRITTAGELTRQTAGDGDRTTAAEAEVVAEGGDEDEGQASFRQAGGDETRGWPATRPD